jgi:hypothetical protein
MDLDPLAWMIDMGVTSRPSCGCVGSANGECFTYANPYHDMHYELTLSVLCTYKPKTHRFLYALQTCNCARMQVHYCARIRVHY